MHHLIDKLNRADSDNKIEGQIILIAVANAIGASKWRENLDSRKLSAKIQATETTGHGAFKITN
jgi:predicted deacylase